MFKMGLHDPFEYFKHKLWPIKSCESKCQFDFRPLKVGNRPEINVYKWRTTYCRKALNKAYNFTSDFTSIEILNHKLWPSKMPKVPISRILGLPTWES